MRDSLKKFVDFIESTGTLTLTVAELSVLQLLRQENIDALTVRFREGKMSKLEIEHSIPIDDIKADGVRVSVPNGSEYETVSFTKMNGKVIRATRHRPFPLTNTENKPEFFTKIEVLRER